MTNPYDIYFSLIKRLFWRRFFSRNIGLKIMREFFFHFTMLVKTLTPLYCSNRALKIQNISLILFLCLYSRLPVRFVYLYLSSTKSHANFDAEQITSSNLNVQPLMTHGNVLIQTDNPYKFNILPNLCVFSIIT